MAHHDSGDEIGSARTITTGTLLGASVALGFCGLGIALTGSIESFFLFAAALALFVCPGYFVVRGRFSGAERVMGGAAIGYVLSSLLASVLYQWRYLNMGSALAASLLLAGGLAVVLGRSSAERSGRLGPTKWMAVCLAVTLCIVALPFLRVGETTPEGVAYRAYFSADLMTHLSVVAELQKRSTPPENPFYRGETLGYYWLFFLFPSLMGRAMGNQAALLMTYLAGAVLFTGLAFSAARRLASTPARACLVVVAGLAAASYEGLIFLIRCLWLGAPLESFRDVNVDAVSRWIFGLTSLDGLHRSLLYTPQHLFSYSLLLVVVLLILRGEPRGLGSSVLSGLLLGGMAGASIVTAMLVGPWLVAVRVGRGGGRAALVRDLAAIGLVSLACLGWYLVLGFFGEAGTALVLRHPRLPEIPAIVLMECGALFVLSLPGWSDRRSIPFLLLAAMSFIAVMSLDIRGYEGVWMPWRAGSVLLVSLVLVAALGIGKWSLGARAWILVPAALTVGLDVYNAQDTGNRTLSAGDFRWTTVFSAGEIEAVRWIRSRTDPSSIVQWDSRAREPGEWAMIPALAERRMAVGFPIFLLEREKYRRRERREVRPIFNSQDPVEAHRLAADAGVDYLFIGRRELEVRGERVRKFWDSPGLFESVFSNDEVSIFRVRRR